MAVLNKRAIVTAIEMYGVTAIKLPSTLDLNYSAIVQALFANNEQGFAYDPNDLTTMFQDAAGTVPVTAVGQAVGMMLDKSKGVKLGEELSKITSPFTVFRDASSSIISPSVATLSAGKTYLVITDIADTPQGTSDWRVSGSSLNTVASVQVGAKAGRHTCLITVIGGSNLQLFGSNVGTSITVNAVSVRELKGNHAYQTTSASRPILRQNAVTGAYYLEFDGSDDFLQTNNIDFTGTDKVSLFAGVNVPLGANTGCVVELGTNATVNNGSFGLFKGPSTIQWASRGTSGVLGAIYNSPVSPDVLTAKAFINGSVLTTRRNSLLVINDTRSQGTGNYSNYPLYIGRRAGTSLPFNGHIYGLIGIGKLTSDNETAGIEKELAKRVGVTLNV